MDLATWSATEWSAAGLLSLAVLLILWGKLVPKSVVNDIRNDRDARLVEARSETDDWKVAYQAVEEARRLQAQQLGELLELAKTTDHLIRSLDKARKVDQ